MEKCQVIDCNIETENYICDDCANACDDESEL